MPDEHLEAGKVGGDHYEVDRNVGAYSLPRPWRNPLTERLVCGWEQLR
jgi:hypothetical protein